MVKNAEGARADNAAVEKWDAFKSWSKEHLETAVGDTMFQIYQNSDHGEERHSVDMSMKEYLTYMTSKGGADEEPLWLVDYRLTQTAPTLLEDLKNVSFFDSIKQSLSNYQFMIAPRKAGASCHFHHSAANALVFGRKRWFLFPPAHVCCFSAPK